MTLVWKRRLRPKTKREATQAVPVRGHTPADPKGHYAAGKDRGGPSLTVLGERSDNQDMRQIGAWSQQAQAKGKGKDKGKDKGQTPTLAAKSWRLTVLGLAAGVGGLLALADSCTQLAVLVLGA